MRLRQLKLAGFKSFVDAVTIPLPSQLVAVVGPNGCGKSNVIDAVRWVMGESQAKQLRGEAMTDVIFKGSTHRKSIGQASVELIFDNNLGKLSGPFATYQEIAVKRTVNRDGESTYFLNGTRCRRRDITDIFLGTGVGARGYSVIGQDTISRLIEARPEELRAYLEEAAGVSKYKERRRETMQRMAQTRENLARVADIQAELAKQSARLERQAKTAQRYLQYKQEEQEHRFTIHALKWRQFHTEQQDCISATVQMQREYDAHQTQLATYLQTRAAQQEMLQALSQSYQDTQQLFYQNKTELVRLEETIQHQKLRQQQYVLDEQRMMQEFAQIAQHLQSDQAASQISQQCLQRLEIELKTVQNTLEKSQVDLKILEKTELDWKATWQISTKALSAIERDEQLEILKQKHQQERETQLKVQYERQQQILALIQEDQLAADIVQAKLQQESAETAHQALLMNHQQLLQQSDVLRQQHLEIDHNLNQLNDNLQYLTEEYAGIQAAQAAALKIMNVSSITHTHTRVVERLSVAEDIWRRMAEHVLGDSLQAVVIDNMAEILPTLETMKNQSMLFTQLAEMDATGAYPRLTDKLCGMVPRWSMDVTQILAAENLQQALDWLPILDEKQSVVTPDGYWLGHGWIRVFDLSPADESGLLTRQHALSQLTNEIGVMRTRRQHLIDTREQCHLKLADLQHQQSTLQKQLAEAAEFLRHTQVMYEQKRQTEMHALVQKRQGMEACEAMMIELESICEARQNIEITLASLAENREQERAHQAHLLREKACWETKWQEAKTVFQHIHTTSQALKLQYSQEEAKYGYLQQQIERSQQQLATLTERQTQLQAEMTALHAPLAEMQISLDVKLHEHQQLDFRLISEQQQLESYQECLQETEKLCKYEEQQVNDLQLQLQQLHLQEQTVAARALQHVEALSAMQPDWETRLIALPSALTLKESEAALILIESNMARLGPINLLAVNEYTESLERQSHLDIQSKDLAEALATLERAIAKMDQETRQRFKDTFNQVNTAFQTLFPRLFGGGHATLEMTCDNLLEAGVLVMAQPPGKRNNTIYMLSGGEKVMTALALVFAIFQLNPSPFCMLDEVDAPLDEANVRRFCELVREMSHVVQFLLITHNKVTMEVAEHLIGVTMREPGVSRIVSVDVTTMI